MKNKTLLEKAREIKTFRRSVSPVGEEDYELLRSYLDRKIKFKQAIGALGFNHNQTTSFYAWFKRGIESAYDQGKLKWN